MPLVKCPLCSRQVVLTTINSHIDSNCKKFCLFPSLSKPIPKKSISSTLKINNKKHSRVPISKSQSHLLSYFIPEHKSPSPQFLKNGQKRKLDKNYPNSNQFEPPHKKRNIIKSSLPNLIKLSLFTPSKNEFVSFPEVKIDTQLYKSCVFFFFLENVSRIFCVFFFFFMNFC